MEEHNLLALPDTVLSAILACLPSADKKAARLVCRELCSAVNSSVQSLLVTEANVGQLGAGNSTFLGVAHVCICISPRDYRLELLTRILETFLPRLLALRCLDLSYVCRDVLLGRTHDDALRTWGSVVRGLPSNRALQLLLHMPATLRGPASAEAPPDYASHTDASGPPSSGAAFVRARTGGPTGDVPYAAGACALLADMLQLLRMHRPDTELHFVSQPQDSKRYDKPRIPHALDIAALAAHHAHTVAALVVGPESFWAVPGQALTSNALQRSHNESPWQAAGAAAEALGAMSLAPPAPASPAGALPWASTFAAAGQLKTLVCYEVWPLAALACLTSLTHMVLVDHQAVLDRERLCAADLAPLAALAGLTRLEVASLVERALPAAGTPGARQPDAAGGAAGRQARSVWRMIPLPQVGGWSVAAWLAFPAASLLTGRRAACHECVIPAPWSCT
jgi:hypothetical protein